MKDQNATFATILLVCVVFLPSAQAVNPPPDGGYPGFNTAEGQNALLSLTTGVGNTAVGWFSLGSNTDGGFNTALGAGALFANTSQENTAVGAGALLSNTNGPHNTAVGALALFSNTEGNVNTAIGHNALASNTTGISNTANGAAALRQNIDGDFNSAFGVETLYSNTEGRFNTALGGYRALDRNTTGDSNTGVGSFALFNNQTGNLNTAIGAEAGEDITGSGNVCIGEGVPGEAGVNDRTYIRNVNTTAQSFSAGVNNYVTVRLTDGRLGHTQVVSSRRYKEDIKPLAAASEALYALKPVSFRLKKEYDEAQPLAFGLIAEEVERVDPALVYRNDKGQVESVRYEMVNAMLLNEFLKEHKKVEELESAVASLAATVKEQAAQIQKVSAELDTSRPAPQVVNNP